MSTLDLDGLKNELRNYEMQRDQAQVNYQQLIGAIFVLNNMIKQITESQNEGALENGQVDSQDSK